MQPHDLFTEPTMRHLVTTCLLIVGLIHLMPLAGVLGAERLAGLYGLPARLLEDPNLVILMRHRAVLFGLLGGFLLLAAFRPNLQAIALVMGVASVLSFLGLAWIAGPHHAPFGGVVTADLIALLALIVGGGARLLR